MEKKLFGHRARKTSNSRVPGQPAGKMTESSEGKAKGGPEGYEGKEHVKYKNPGFTRHEIRFPQDEPHMRSHVGKEEMHEMEDDYHMDVPDQTAHELEAKIKRARMKADAPNHDEPKPLLGNLTHNVSKKGYVDEDDGEELEGPHDMQSGSKESRKKMIVAVTRRKMKKSK